MEIFRNNILYIEVHESEIPWLKIFTIEPFKELFDTDEKTRNELWRVLEICEHAMKCYFNPDKINIASFGNYLPKLHIHIQARFIHDSYYPESMWGIKQREGNIICKNQKECWEEIKNQCGRG